MVEFGLQSAQTRFDVSKTVSVSKLGEGHAEKLIEAAKSSDSVIALVSSDTIVEFVFGQKVHELREDDSSRIHRSLLSTIRWKEYDRKRCFD
jgi:3-hydroxyisobutyrate dehydrogenase-like beta-hydroxyacid dehydrogenase